MAGDIRRHSGGQPMRVCIVEGDVNVALGWTDSLEERRCCQFITWPDETDVLIEKHFHFGHIVLTVGTSILNIWPIYGCVLPGSILRVRHS